MLYRVLADVVVLLHTAFVVFVVGGGVPGLAVALGRVGARPLRAVGHRHRVRRLDLPAHAARERVPRPRRARGLPRRLRGALRHPPALPGRPHATGAGDPRHAGAGGEPGRLRHAGAATGASLRGDELRCSRGDAFWNPSWRLGRRCPPCGTTRWRAWSVRTRPWPAALPTTWPRTRTSGLTCSRRSRSTARSST